MRFPIAAACLMGALSLPGDAQLLINEFAATNSDRLLVREPGAHPRVGNTIPWQSAAYDDSGWRSGAGPFGFGDTGGITLGTNVAEVVQNRTPSLYLRMAFSVSAATAGSGSMLQLEVGYNDGFIAFLNGIEIARRNLGFAGTFAYRDQPAYNVHSGSGLETIDLGAANTLLEEGDNLLCIQVHNQSVTGSAGTNLLMAAELRLASGPVIADGGGAWRYFAGLAEPSGGLVDHGWLAMEEELAPDVPWATPGFDDSTWPSGTGPVGIEASSPPDYLLGVDLGAEMRGITPSVYVRSSFTVTAAEADSAFPLSLEVDFDDGMIVYLNGFEVYRDNLGTTGIPTDHTVTADGNHPATGDNGNPEDRSQTITLGAARDLLVAGDNVVGLQLHNSSLTSSDLIAMVTLRTTGSSPRALASPGDAVRYFVGLDEPAPGPGEDDIGEIEEAPDSENDWIEIRNTSALDVPLDGWSLSDDPGEPRKWSFPPGAVIPTHGYHVVIASGLDLTPESDGTDHAHTNFKLAASGGRIVLSRPDDQVEDELVADYPPQSWRCTYGRQADGAFGYLALGTPGGANAGPALDAAPAPPGFSVEGGFHPSPLSIVLTGPTPGSTIRYTTDGSDPLDGAVYGGPIPVSANTVIRARCLLPDAIPSEIVTHTYLINQGAAYQGLAAICLSGDPARTFYGPNTTGGPADGEGIFAINGGVYDGGVWNSNGETTAFNNPLNHGRPFEKPGALEFLPLAGNPLRTELGLRVAGSGHTRLRLTITDPIDQPFTSTSVSATKFEKPSFNIFFRPEFGDRPLGYPFFGSNTVTEFDSLRIRAGKNDWYNPFIKDELMRRLFIGTGQVGSHGSFNTLWINGVYKGYYNLTERIREGFLQAHYNSKEAWDVQQVNSFSSGDPTHWNKMISYLRTADLSTLEGYAGVHDYLDVDNYIDYILVNAYAAMGDWPHNNWIAARERSSLGRWRFHMWDAEGAFGFAGRNTSTNMFTEHLLIPDAHTTTNLYVPAIYTLLKDSPEFRLRMADRAQKHLFDGGTLVTSEITAIYNDLKAEVSPIILETTGTAFKTSWHSTWIANHTRHNALISQLAGEGAWPATSAPGINQHGGEIAPGFQLMLTNPNSGGAIHFTTDGSDPRDPGGAVAGTAYTGPVTLTDDTRLRARVFDSGTWSPEIDVNFTLPFAHPTFLPPVTADWTEDANWSSAPASYPDAAGATAVVPGVPGADRNVDLRAPVTVGRLIFDLASTTSRSRVRGLGGGNSLTFSDPAGTAEMVVTGDGKGYAELEVEAGSLLATDLRLDVQHLHGDGEFGALRLRSAWSGPGGLTKAGSGIATLSGGGKDYTGATVVERGVLQVSEPAAPWATSSVTVLPGGQLRLSSGTAPGDPPRDYAFGGALHLSGEGRGAEIPDDEGEGKRGSLRYEPGNTNNHAIISTAVELSAPAEIHVVDPTNRLELLLPLGGSHAVTKSGGGTLVLGGDQSGHSYPITVEAGTLEIRGVLGSAIDLSPTAVLRGHGRTAAIGGEGAIILKQALLEAPASNASHYSFIFGSPGVPDLADPASTTNSTAMLANAPTGILGLDFYLTGPASAPGAVSLGGFIVPFARDLENAVSSATIRVFLPDASGTHEFEGQVWSPAPDSTLTSVAAELSQPAPFHQVRILELRNGGGPPVTFEAWRQANFDPAGLSDPLVSGPLAAPFGDRVANILRYAFGVPPGECSAAYLPRISSTPSSVGIDFPFECARHDLAVTVESTDNLEDWSNPAILFDSTVDFPPPGDDLGRIAILDPRPTVRTRFYRVRIARK